MNDASIPLSAEDALARSEAELAGRERRLTHQFGKLLEEAQRLDGVLLALKGRLEGSMVPDAPEVLEHLSSATLPVVDTDPEIARAQAIREQAISVRHEVAETLELKLKAALEAQEVLRAFLDERAVWLEKEEAAEQARQEQARREAEAQARAEAEARAAAVTSALADPVREEARPAPGEAAPPHAEPTLADTFISPAPGHAPPLPEAARGGGKRERERYALQAAIDLRSDSNFFTGFSTNLSEGGVFLATYQELGVGTEVDLTLTLPGKPGLQLRGTVRWTREASERDPDLSPGLGIQFNGLKAEQLEVIRSFVKGREPLFYPG